MKMMSALSSPTTSSLSSEPSGSAGGSPRPVASSSALRSILPPDMELVRWEEETVNVIQYTIDGEIVARRVDDSSVNGTKMLNLVPNLSRGRRDSALKNIRERVVVLKGPRNLKGVWVPLDDAIALCKRFEIGTKIGVLLQPALCDEVMSHLARNPSLLPPIRPARHANGPQAVASAKRKALAAAAAAASLEQSSASSAGTASPLLPRFNGMQVSGSSTHGATIPPVPMPMGGYPLLPPGMVGMMPGMPAMHHLPGFPPAFPAFFPPPPLPAQHQAQPTQPLAKPPKYQQNRPSPIRVQSSPSALPVLSQFAQHQQPHHQQHARQPSRLSQTDAFDEVPASAPPKQSSFTARRGGGRGEGVVSPANASSSTSSLSPPPPDHSPLFETLGAGFEGLPSTSLAAPLPCASSPDTSASAPSPGDCGTSAITSALPTPVLPNASWSQPHYPSVAALDPAEQAKMSLPASTVAKDAWFAPPTALPPPPPNAAAWTGLLQLPPRAPFTDLYRQLASQPLSAPVHASAMSPPGGSYFALPPSLPVDLPFDGYVPSTPNSSSTASAATTSAAAAAAIAAHAAVLGSAGFPLPPVPAAIPPQFLANPSGYSVPAYFPGAAPAGNAECLPGLNLAWPFGNLASADESAANVQQAAQSESLRQTPSFEGWLAQTPADEQSSSAGLGFAFAGRRRSVTLDL